MREADVLAILSRLCAQRPSDLDSDLFDPPTVTAGSLLSIGSAQLHRISPKLWNRYEEGTMFIGIRETKPLDDYTQVTARLLSAALERGVAPIILTTLGYTGFTRFGLRVERLSGETEAERATSEAQISALWDLAIVIDADQVAALG